MAQLFELLAVEPDLRDESKDALKKAKAILASAALVGQTISFHKVVEDAEDIPTESVELATTVQEVLELVQRQFANYCDVSLSKEIANINTDAHVQVGGKRFLSNLPAPALLNLEARLAELIDLYKAIPTLDPTEKWEWDANQGCYVSDVRVAYRTKKVPKSFVAYEATKEHPAQVQVFQEDIPTHRRETVVRSGKLTVADKASRVQRIEGLLREVKQARQRANDIDAEHLSFMNKILNYIDTGQLDLE